MAIVPVRSLPLFAFANDGSIAWLRAAGSKVMCVDAKSGEVLREVQLEPAPFGITWSIERVGRFFVVKDDRETAAYDGEHGKRLWKRSSGPTRVAYVGQNGERHVTIAPGPAGVEVLETDLETGEVSPKLTLDGTMHYIGVHGTITHEGLLFLTTDQRDVFAVDTRQVGPYCRCPVVRRRHGEPGRMAAGKDDVAPEETVAGSNRRKDLEFCNMRAL